MTNRSPQPGDTLVVQKSDERCDVFKLTAAAAWELLRGGVPTIQTARQIARANLAPDGHEVFYRHETETERDIRPF